MNEQKLLVLSNGHGEDIIAVRILEQLQHHPTPPQVTVLPIVGKGHAYNHLDVQLAGPVQQMPSGGFIYMDKQQLWRDLQGGLLQLTLSQGQVVQQWRKSGGKILAVGDIVPLFFAWSSGAEYAFVGTAKSDYYLRDESGWLPKTNFIERWSGSSYFPWERWLMGRPRCKAVFPRDSLTNKILQQFSIPAFDLGNPMMDGIEVNKNENYNPEDRSLIILLLPGSRLPEALRNWQLILQAIPGILKAFPDRPLVFFGAIAPALPLTAFEQCSISQGWLRQAAKSLPAAIAAAGPLALSRNKGMLVLVQHAYSYCLQAAYLAIAMAGTATEQFVGLGKPAIAIPGQGPQFTPVFAEAQTRLLGCSVTLVPEPLQVGSAIQSLLNNPERLQEIAENGRRRMGKPGAAERIARCLQERLLS